MTGTDDLRDKLTDVMMDARDRYPRRHDDAPSEVVVDALMPVVREACAKAWDDALNNAALTLYADDTVMHNAIYAAWLSDQRRANPWREDRS